MKNGKERMEGRSRKEQGCRRVGGGGERSSRACRRSKMRRKRTTSD